MTPEPYPTPWRWVDLGLPSGTLWLDRNVGANSPEDVGLYFMWGQKFGHRAGSDYSFDPENYEAEGLVNISSDLTPSNDGASIYYGSQYRMPSFAQIEELIQSTTVVNGENYIELRSNVNGNSIRIPNSGYIIYQRIQAPESSRFDCRSYLSGNMRYTYINSDIGAHIGDTTQRSRGIPIRPVYNS